jgi:hypothetical protein
MSMDPRTVALINMMTPDGYYLQPPLIRQILATIDAAAPPATESEIREKIAQEFDAEAARCDAKVREYGILGLGAMYGRERDIAERNARNVRNPAERKIP